MHWYFTISFNQHEFGEVNKKDIIQFRKYLSLYHLKPLSLCQNISKGKLGEFFKSYCRNPNSGKKLLYESAYSGQLDGFL